jgi:hypothetical protein
MVSSGMLRRVALLRTDVSEELSASFIKVTRISKLGTMLVTTMKTSNLKQISSLHQTYTKIDVIKVGDEKSQRLTGASN